jgi:hypothetical protein
MVDTNRVFSLAISAALVAVLLLPPGSNANLGRLGAGKYANITNGGGGNYTCCTGEAGGYTYGGSCSGNVLLWLESYFANSSGSSHSGAAQIQLQGSHGSGTYSSGSVIVIPAGTVLTISAVNFFRNTVGGTFTFAFKQWVTNAGNITNRGLNPSTLTVACGGTLAVLVSIPPMSTNWAGIVADGKDITAVSGKISYDTRSGSYLTGSSSSCNGEEETAAWIGIGGADYGATGSYADMLWQAGIIIDYPTSGSSVKLYLFAESIGPLVPLSAFLQSNQNLSNALGSHGTIAITAWLTSTDSYFTITNANTGVTLWSGDYYNIYPSQHTYAYSPPDVTSGEWTAEAVQCGAGYYPSPTGEQFTIYDPAYTDGSYSNTSFAIPAVFYSNSILHYSSPGCAGGQQILYQNMVPS